MFCWLKVPHVTSVFNMINTCFQTVDPNPKGQPQTLRVNPKP